MISIGRDPVPEGQPSAGERRASVRQVSSWEGSCERLSGRSDHLWWFAQVRDLSAQGIGLVLKHRFDPGVLLLVEMTSPDLQRSQRFQAQVVHTTPIPEGWLVGCAFLNVLGEEREGERGA
jgi:hypothetical protein